MISGRWLLVALAAAGTLAGWVALAERVPLPASARVEPPPDPMASPEATAREPTALEPVPAVDVVVDVAPDVTSAATRRRGRR